MRTILVAALVFVGFVTVADDVPTDPNKVSPILVGREMPNVSFKNKEGKRVKLSEIRDGKPTVLVYYRGGWCPYCNMQLAALGKQKDELTQLGFKLVGVTADKPELIRSMVKEKEPGFELFSDNTMESAKQLGIAFKLADETVKMYKERYRIDIEASSGMKHHILPVPSVFVLNDRGDIIFEYVNPNYKVRLDNEVLMAAARAALK